MIIYYEDTMPYGEKLFSSLGEARAFSGATIEPNVLSDASMLFVRSTTKVDASLLKNCKRLKLIGTGTSGSDHVDVDYVSQCAIPFVSAKGSNACAVAEYIMSAIFNSAMQKKWNPFSRSVGIVGAGCVGTELAKKCRALGIPHKLCDPLLEKGGDTRAFVSFNEVMKCDTISLHIPLIKYGSYPTYHLISKDVLLALQPHQLLINASRGEVLDNRALLNLFEAEKSLNVILDVWETEPDILTPLLPYLIYATPHIAGHSLEGKARGTYMMYESACKLLKIQPSVSFESLLPTFPIERMILDKQTALSAELVTRIVNMIYDVREDNELMQKMLCGDTKPSANFRYYRKNYAIRREFSVLKVISGKSEQSKALYQLGFDQ